MVSDLELAEKVHEFLRVSNLKKTTNNIVIKALESHFGVDLSHKKPFLRNQVDRFLQNQYNYSEEYELDFAIDRHHHGNDGVSDSGDDGGDFSADVQADNGSSSFKNIAKFQRKNKLKNKRECESGKVCTLSPQLQKFLGVVHMSRTEVLKHLWTYVRAKNLQDPMDEKTIICDETLRELFSVDSINNLQINKALTKHILRSATSSFATVSTTSIVPAFLESVPEEEEIEGVEVMGETEASPEAQSDNQGDADEVHSPTASVSLSVSRFFIIPDDDDVDKFAFQETGTEKSTKRERSRKKEREAPFEVDPDGTCRKKVYSGFLAPLPLSENLIKFLGTGESALTRPDVIRRVWEYIKDNNLQDPFDKKTVICDEKLKELFNVDTFHGFTVSKLLTEHFVKM